MPKVKEYTVTKGNKTKFTARNIITKDAELKRTSCPLDTYLS